MRPWAVASGWPAVSLKSSEGCIGVVDDGRAQCECSGLTSTDAMIPRSYPNVTDPSAAKRPHNHVYTYVCVGEFNRQRIPERELTFGGSGMTDFVKPNNESDSCRSSQWSARLPSTLYTHTKHRYRTTLRHKNAWKRSNDLLTTLKG